MRNYFKYIAYLFVIVGISSASAGAYDDFFRAVDTNDGTTITQLLVRGFDPNAQSEKGQPGIVLAMSGQDYRAAEALLAHPGLNVDAPNPAGETALMLAALRGSVEWCQRLIEKGARVNREGWTPLHYAASGTNAKVISLLLDRGAKIDAAAANGATALMMAASYGSEDAVVLLLARGANAGLRDMRNQSAADFALGSGRAPLASTLQQAAR